MSRLRPKVVLWWGIGLIALYLVLNFTVPGLAYAANGNGGGGANPLDQAMLGTLFTVLSTVNMIAPFLGVTLIGASIVMFYVEKNLIRPTLDPVVTETENVGITEPDASS